MLKLDFELNLLSPVIVSSSAANVDFSSLGHIPASALRGVLGAHYEDLGDSADVVLFSGDVLFTPAFLKQGEEIFYPMPYCFYEKRGSVGEIWNVLLKAPEHPEKYKKKKGGYVSSSCFSASPEKEAYVKTAIQRETGAAKEGDLFSYEALSPGQTFAFSVLLKDHSLKETLKSALEGRHQIGRSRSAEFGSVQIRYLEDSQMKEPEPIGEKGSYYAYVLSPLVPVPNEAGNPLPPLDSTSLGLPGGDEWDAQSSVVRVGHVSHYNYFKQIRRKGVPRIAEGSVLKVKGKLPDHEFMRAGLYTGEEAGILWVNPPFLRKVDFTLESYSMKPERAKETLRKRNNILLKTYVQSNDSNDLSKWLKESSKGEISSKKYDDLLKEATKKIEDALAKADQEPTASAWGEIRKIIENEDSFEKIEKRLFDPENGFLRSGIRKETWEQDVGSDQPLHAALKASLKVLHSKDINFQTTRKMSLDLVKRLADDAKTKRGGNS